MFGGERGGEAGTEEDRRAAVVRALRDERLGQAQRLAAAPAKQDSILRTNDSRKVELRKIQALHITFPLRGVAHPAHHLVKRCTDGAVAVCGMG